MEGSLSHQGRGSVARQSVATKAVSSCKRYEIKAKDKCTDDKILE